MDCSERLKADFSLVLKKYLVKLTSSPKVIHDQNMTLQFELCHGELTSNSSGYTSTVINSDDIQTHFREIIIATVAKSNKLVIRGAFNCTDHTSSEGITGNNRIGNLKSTLLFRLCAANDVLTNDTFVSRGESQQNNIVHPSLENWHVIDSVIVKK